MEREEEILGQLAAQGNLRGLRTVRTERGRLAALSPSGEERTYCNLSSNDYLGLAECDLQREFLSSTDPERFLLGNPSSRLMTGNSPAYEALERCVAKLTGSDEALVLGAGFAVNSGVLPAVTQRGDLILADKLVHASLIDGLRLCDGVEWQRFRHNDMNHLASLLSKAATTAYDRIIVVTESLFSMDGDFAPLGELAQLQQRYGFRLYLDEAHAVGIYGAPGHEGAGLLAAYNAAHPEVPLRADYLVVTFGKALASVGAAVCCSTLTKALLVNRMRPLIFSTAMPDISLEWTRFVIERMPAFAPRRERLRKLIATVNRILKPTVPYESQIIPIPAGSNERALQMADTLREAGYWTTAIRHPTVPRGEARLRVSLCASHEVAEIEQFATRCKQLG